MRMKVVFNVEEPLKIGFTLKRKDKPTTRISFKYERLPDLCYHYGRLGHVAIDMMRRRNLFLAHGSEQVHTA
ncbi:hypothetical protein REPUB_Repub10bG0115800 [Reevesia pubescens]